MDRFLDPQRRCASIDEKPGGMRGARLGNR